MKYTIDDLIKIKKEYRANFEKLIKVKFNSPARLALIKEERRLNHLERQIISDLGTNAIWEAISEGKLK